MWLSLRMREHLQSEGEQEPEPPQLLLLDDHPSSPLDAGWDVLFGATTRILRVRADALRLRASHNRRVLARAMQRDSLVSGARRVVRRHQCRRITSLASCYLRRRNSQRHSSLRPASDLIPSLCTQIIPPPGYSSLLLADTLSPSLPQKLPSKLFAHFSHFLLKSFGVKSQLCEAAPPEEVGALNVVLVTRRAGKMGSVDRQSLNEIPLVNLIMTNTMLLLLMLLLMIMMMPKLNRHALLSMVNC